MFWKIRMDDGLEASGLGEREGRFVLHRHRDGLGEHLDLRLECDGYLLGWRMAPGVDGEEQFASEKGPHPVRWLDEEEAAVVVDRGVYGWLERDGDGGSLFLEGEKGLRRVVVSRVDGLTVEVACGIEKALRDLELPMGEAGALIVDGVVSRRRAVERLCGLGRELDGGDFEEETWRKTLGLLSLEEIHGQLRAFESRFDAKYPPAPVSIPEGLGDEGEASRSDAALSIVRG